MRDYRFRAECTSDVGQLRRLLEEKKHQFTMDVTFGNRCLEVEVYLKVAANSKIDLYLLRYYMGLIPDGHVMRQTLAPADCYTGERDYEI